MALPSSSPLRSAGSLGGEVLSRKAKKRANMPSDQWAEHLFEVEIPMLFLQEC
jgi:hypothetical protein